MKKTYKGVMNKSEMSQSFSDFIKIINNAKQEIIEKNPFYKQYVKEIPNAGIYIYNKSNDFIKELEENSITDTSIIYATLKDELFRVIAGNLTDLITYLSDEKEEEEIQMPKFEEELSIMQVIKEFIRVKVFRRSVTDEMRINIEEYMENLETFRWEHLNEVIDRVEDISKIEMNEEFVTKSILNFLSCRVGKEDFNFEVFETEATEELEKLGMINAIQELQKEIKKYKGFKENIKLKADEKNDVMQNINTNNNKTIQANIEEIK